MITITCTALGAPLGRAPTSLKRGLSNHPNVPGRVGTQKPRKPLMEPPRPGEDQADTCPQLLAWRESRVDRHAKKIGRKKSDRLRRDLVRENKKRDRRPRKAATRSTRTAKFNTDWKAGYRIGEATNPGPDHDNEKPEETVTLCETERCARQTHFHKKRPQRVARPGGLAKPKGAVLRHLLKKRAYKCTTEDCKEPTHYHDNVDPIDHFNPNALGNQRDRQRLDGLREEFHLHVPENARVDNPRRHSISDEEAEAAYHSSDDEEVTSDEESDKSDSTVDAFRDYSGDSDSNEPEYWEQPLPPPALFAFDDGDFDEIVFDDHPMVVHMNPLHAPDAEEESSDEEEETHHEVADVHPCMVTEDVVVFWHQKDVRMTWKKRLVEFLKRPLPGYVKRRGQINPDHVLMLEDNYENKKVVGLFQKTTGDIRDDQNHRGERSLMTTDLDYSQKSRVKIFPVLLRELRNDKKLMKRPTHEKETGEVYTSLIMECKAVGAESTNYADLWSTDRLTFNATVVYFVQCELRVAAAFSGCLKTIPNQCFQLMARERQPLVAQRIG
jgi:hypothetical protein